MSDVGHLYQTFDLPTRIIICRPVVRVLVNHNAMLAFVYISVSLWAIFSGLENGGNNCNK